MGIESYCRYNATGERDSLPDKRRSRVRVKFGDAEMEAEGGAEYVNKALAEFADWLRQQVSAAGGQT
jgi:hypothetical protein